MRVYYEIQIHVVHVVRHLIVLEFDCALFRNCCLDSLESCRQVHDQELHVGLTMIYGKRSLALALRSDDRMFK